MLVNGLWYFYGIYVNFLTRRERVARAHHCTIFPFKALKY